MKAEKILEIGILAGNLLMESGAEVYRVEDTMVRLCKACKEVELVESYVMATGIMLTVKMDGLSHTRICRIRSRNTNLGRIEEVNKLSRDVQIHDYTAEEVEERLKEIANQKGYPNWINVLFGAIGAGAFAMFFDGNLKEIEYAFIIGFILRVFMIGLNQIKMNDFINNILGASLIGFLSILMHRFDPFANIDTLVISGIMLLVPGLAVTNAIRDTLSGDFISASARAMEACLIACSIALGATLALTIGGAL